MAVGQSGVPIQGYDQDAWCAEFRGSRQAVPRLLRQIRALREVNLDFVTGLPRALWSRYGMHSERGHESVRRTMDAP